MIAERCRRKQYYGEVTEEATKRRRTACAPHLLGLENIVMFTDTLSQNLLNHLRYKCIPWHHTTPKIGGFHVFSSF